MGERSDLPRIKPEKEPSYFNHTAGLYGDIAQTAGYVADGVVKTKYWQPISLVLGAAIGGVIGKAKQEREAVEGRIVKTPSIWNVGIFTGSAVASALVLPVSLTLQQPTGLAALLLGAAPIVGSAVGMVVRKKELQKDFDKAMSIRNQELAELKMLKKQQAKALEPEGYKNTVTPEEAALLADKQSPVVSHEEALHAERHDPEQTVAQR